MQRFKKILCVMEQGTDSKPALERAVALAENNQAELMVADVIPRVPAVIGILDGGHVQQDLQMAMAQEHGKRMESLIDPYQQRVDIRQKVLLGTPFLEVIREVLHNGHDLVIKCPESPSWLDRLFSGDDMHLLRKCPCPVWLVQPGASRSYKRILAAVDVDESYSPKELATRHALNVQILEMAATLALSEFAELHVVHVWEAIYESINGFVFSSDISPEQATFAVEQERRQHQQWLDTFLQNSGNKATREALDYLSPQRYLIKGEAEKEIPVLAKRQQIDCIVMGTVARTGVRGFFMGNTAETILAQIDCSVLAIKPHGFVTPVTLAG